MVAQTSVCALFAANSLATSATHTNARNPFLLTALLNNLRIPPGGEGMALC
jgi:hypothetical protein